MKKFLIALLTLCLAFSLIACGGEQETSSKEESKTESSVVSVNESSEASSKEETSEEAITFEVKVVDGDGNAVKGVMVQICKDACVPAITNDEGVATFNVEITDGYKLSVVSCPAGYEYTGDAEIYLESGITEYTLEISAK